jgi:transposase
MATSSETYVGIDVSKDRLDVAVLGERQETQVENSREGIARLVQQMLELEPELIVVEATGGYQRAVAVFGQKVQPRRYTGKSEAEKQLSARLVRRRQLDEILKAEQNRLRTISSSLKSFVQRMIACLKEEKKILDMQIQQFVAEQEVWQEQTEILGSAPGGGKVTTATLLADLPELGKMDRKKTLAPHASAGVAALVGVAPMNYDSGKKRGYRKTKGGRGDVRSVLYMATLVATHYKPLIRAQYQQLLKRGKLKKVALTACMRKFLTILNAMMRDKPPFRCASLP